jgi:hypothetical protein
MTLSSQVILPKGFINLQQTLSPQNSYSLSCSNLPAEGQLISLSSNIFDLKIILKASELDLFCTGFS